MSYLWVTIGSALGGLLRYTITQPHTHLQHRFPFGTILINVIGSFVIGYFGTLTLQNGRFPPPTTSASSSWSASAEASPPSPPSAFKPSISCAPAPGAERWQTSFSLSSYASPQSPPATSSPIVPPQRRPSPKHRSIEEYTG